MALKITLRPNERMIIDGTVVSNGGSTCNLFIENKVPILREKNIMSEKDSNSPCRRIYFVVQLMYIDRESRAAHHETYWRLIKDLVDAAPSVLGLIDQISEHVVNSRYYQALKWARKLIHYEEEVFFNVRQSTAGL